MGQPWSVPAFPDAPPRALLQSGGVYAAQELLDTRLLVSSFGEDEAGEVYVVNYNGSVHRLLAA